MAIVAQLRAAGHASRASLVVAVVIGCAPADDPDPLPIDVCGQQQPVQILPLGDAEIVEHWSGSARFGDRWLFGVRRFEIPLTSLVSTTIPPDMRPFAQLDARVESVGACGEDRRVVAEDVDILFPPFADDDPWLGCRNDTGDLYWIDPEGASPASWIARVDKCGRHIARGREVYALSDDGDFVRAGLGDAGVAVEILVTDVVSASFFETPGLTGLRPQEDAFLRRGEDRELVRVDLSTGEVDQILDRVDDFSISADRRWLVWIRRVPDDPNDVAVPEARLLDRSTGEERVLGRREWSEIQAYIGVGFAVATGGDALGAVTEQQVISLPDVHSTFVEKNQIVRGSDGNRVVIGAGFGSIDVLDLSTGERQVVFETYRSVDVKDGEIWYEDGKPYAGLDIPATYLPKDVMRMPIDTLAPSLAHSRVFSRIELPGDRWATTGDYDENFLFDLMLVDGESLEVRRIDDGVVGMPPPYERPSVDEHGQPWRTDELVYQVHERASDRGGMWRVRFSD